MQAKDFLYFGTLTAGTILSFIRYRSLRRAERIIALLLIITLMQEVASFVYFTQHRNNIIFLRLFSVIEFVSVIFYYLLLVQSRNIRFIISMLAIGGLLWFLFHWTDALETLKGLSFLLYEAFVILLISLLSCFHLVLRENINPFQLAGFWVTLSFIVYWSVVYTRFGLFVFPDSVSIDVQGFLESAFFFTNVAFYGTLAAILGFYKRFTAAT